MLSAGFLFSQESVRNLDDEKLNEVKDLRKKKRVDVLKNSTALSSSVIDHLNFMVKNNRLTHIQRWNNTKKTSKTRADFYESGFEIIGENVQYTSIKNIKEELKVNRKVDNLYEALAKVLVENWKNSPPHYANMINSDYHYTYTEIKITETGRIYACQLFGGSQSKDQ